MILGCILLITSFNVFAQLPSIGIKGGVNFATLSASGQANNVVAGTNLQSSSGNITSFNVGIFADIKLKNLSLQPAIFFTGKGGTFDGSTGALPDGSTSEVHSKYSLYYIQVPVNLVYHFPVVLGEFYLGAGPYAGTGISGKLNLSAVNTKTGPFEGSQDIKFGNESGDIKRMDYGVNAIGGIKLKTGIMFNLNYDLGLADILQQSDGTKMKTRVLGLSVGYSL